jgi:cytochrome P450
MFWHGGALPLLGQACVRSFTARGHRVRVHAYEPIILPAGAERSDARHIIAEDDPLQRLRTGASIAAFADCFRYALLHQQGGWWMDTDVCCLTGELPQLDRAWAEQESGIINNAILRLPAGDPLAGRLAQLAHERARPGMPWGTVGPDLVTEVLGSNAGVDAEGLRPAFYPVHWREAHLLWLPERRDEVAARLEGARFLHCWAQALENMGIDLTRRAPAGSYLADLLNDIPGARALSPLTMLRTRASIRKHARARAATAQRCGDPARASAGAARGKQPLDRTVTWLRRHAVIPLRAARLGLRIPPGTLEPVQSQIDTDRMFIFDRARRFGPVFKVLVNDSYTTCVIGHARGARLIAGNEPRLSGYTVDLESLFPIGALRGMTGETHRRYRRQFLHAVQATPLAAHAAEVDRFMRNSLEEISAAGPVGGDALRDRLRRMSGAIMMRMLYGIDPGTPRFDALEKHYRRFGPAAPVYKVEPDHARAFADIQAEIGEHAARVASDGAGIPPCVLRHMARSGEADATAMGNLAYLYEPAHFDLYSLWHWMLKMLADHPQVQETFRAMADGAMRRAYAEAIVHETLRMEQSELLYWRVSADIAFEGFLIPRGTTLRICIWEGHKDA